MKYMIEIGIEIDKEFSSKKLKKIDKEIKKVLENNKIVVNGIVIT